MNYEALPVYAQIAAELRENINQGIYQVGDKFSSEAELAQRFEVNRHTVRQAISLLKMEGILRVDRGRGMFVAGKTIRYPIGKRVRYNQALKEQGRQGGYELLRMIEVPADGATAKALQVNKEEPVALVERLGLADDEPILVSSSYHSLRVFPDLLEPENIQKFKEIQSVSKLLRELYGCDHIRLSTTVSARLVQPQDARLLKVALNQPILLVESINVDQKGNVVEYGVSRFRGDMVELVFENELPA